MNAVLMQKIEAVCADADRFDLAHAHLRYESLRKLTPIQFRTLHYRNLEGENWDAMIDEFLLEDK